MRLVINNSQHVCCILFWLLSLFDQWACILSQYPPHAALGLATRGRSVPRSHRHPRRWGHASAAWLSNFLPKVLVVGQQFSSWEYMYKDGYGRTEATSKLRHPMWANGMSMWMSHDEVQLVKPHILPWQFHLLRFRRRSAARLERRLARRNSNSSRNLKALEG